MEAAAPPSSSQIPRKEWRAVSNEEQSDDRTMYDVEFCSITIDGNGGLSDEILQQRIQEVARQREGMQNLEIELRAQAITRSEILEVRNGFQLKIKEQTDAALKLKEQIQEREEHIRELEIKLDEKDRELRAVKLDNEAAWAKDDLLREQNKELATFRRECDSLEAERAGHMEQIHDLQEHVQEKESQVLALEEQHRVAQETILFKDGQLREAQTWIARVQEMNALQSTALQAQMRERTEQFNQYWIGIQRQFAEVERHHLQTIQQLQQELAEAKERGVHKEGAKVDCQNSADSSSYVQNKGNQHNASDDGSSNGNLRFISNGNINGHPHASSSSLSSESEHPAGVAVVPSSILGMGAFIPPTQMTALHPFVMQPQGAPQSVSPSNSLIPQTHVSHFQPMSTIAPHQHWQQQQVVSDVSQNLNQNNFQPSPSQQNLLRSDVHYSYELPNERKVIHPDHPNAHVDQQQRSGQLINGSGNKGEAVLQSSGKQYETSEELQQASNTNVPLHPTLRFGSHEQKNEIKVQDQVTVSAINQSLEQHLVSGQQWPASIANISASPSQSINFSSGAERGKNVATFHEPAPAARRTNPIVTVHATEPTLLDERSLLACIVRAIPAGVDGRIRISTTLSNRLAKMLAPLHWHDYKKRYGKLDDFVDQHPELFVIEGDSIHLREGAQEKISATAAFAKVSGATASSAPYSSFPSVALTPVAQIAKHNQQPNGVTFNIAKELSDINISVKSKKLHQGNGLPSEIRPANSFVQNAVGNGANKGVSNGGLSSGGKQARSAGAGVISRR